VRHVIVTGHYGCGGVQRAMGEDRGALVDHWLQPLSMYYRKHRAAFDAMGSESRRFERLCEINVQMQVRRVAATPLVERAWARGAALHLHAWIYGLHDGLLREFAAPLSSIAERDALPPVDDCVRETAEPHSAVRRHAAEAFSALIPDAQAAPACCGPAEPAAVPRLSR
jgi:carbonic anhydrase